MSIKVKTIQNSNQNHLWYSDYMIASVCAIEAEDLLQPQKIEIDFTCYGVESNYEVYPQHGSLPCVHYQEKGFIITFCSDEPTNQK